MVDARCALESEVGHVLAIADRADHRHELAGRDVGMGADGFDAPDHGVYLRLGRPLFHHDHHLSLKPLKVGLHYNDSDGVRRSWNSARHEPLPDA